MALTKADTLRAALVAVGGLSGSIADMQRQYVLLFTAAGTGSVTDIKKRKGLTLKEHFDVPLPPVV